MTIFEILLLIIILVGGLFLFATFGMYLAGYMLTSGKIDAFKKSGKDSKSNNNKTRK